MDVLPALLPRCQPPLPTPGAVGGEQAQLIHGPVEIWAGRPGVCRSEDIARRVEDTFGPGQYAWLPLDVDRKIASARRINNVYGLL